MPLALLLVGGAVLAYFLLHSGSGSSSSSEASSDGSGVAFDAQSPAAPPQGGGSFEPVASGATTSAPGLMLPKLTLPKISAPPRQDLGTVSQNPQFSTAAERAYILAHAPAGQVPHMVVQEGTTRVVNGHTQKMVKWVTPGVGGSDTHWTNVD